MTHTILYCRHFIVMAIDVWRRGKKETSLLHWLIINTYIKLLLYVINTLQIDDIFFSWKNECYSAQPCIIDKTIQYVHCDEQMKWEANCMKALKPQENLFCLWSNATTLENVEELQTSILQIQWNCTTLSRVTQVSRGVTRGLVVRQLELGVCKGGGWVLLPPFLIPPVLSFPRL